MCVRLHKGIGAAWWLSTLTIFWLYLLWFVLSESCILLLLSLQSVFIENLYYIGVQDLFYKCSHIHLTAVANTEALLITSSCTLILQHDYPTSWKITIGYTQKNSKWKKFYKYISVAWHHNESYCNMNHYLNLRHRRCNIMSIAMLQEDCRHWNSYQNIYYP